MPETMSDVIELERRQRRHDFDQAREAILTVLARHAGLPAERSLVRTISRETGLHPSDVQWTLSTLVNKGEIIKVGYSYALRSGS